MRKKVLFLFTFAFLILGGANAQVIMGSTDPVHEGALLELRTNGQTGGLLLPKVELTSATVWAPVDGTPTNGMSVYNIHNTTQNELAGEGVYVWTNDRWYLTASQPCTSLPQLPVLAVKGLDAGNKIDAFKPFLAYVSNPEPGVSYEWTLPAGLIGYSNSNVITIVGSSLGTYDITVQATNECGSSNLQTRTTVTIKNSFVFPPTKGELGVVTLQGITCYDIAKTEGDQACGSLAVRKPAFPDESKRTRTYILSIADNSNMSDLRVGWTNDDAGIIKSVSGDVPGTLTDNSYPITVVFADNINDIVQMKGKSTAKLGAVFTHNGTDKYVELTITVQDCSCCPLDVAYIEYNAAYKGADVIDADLTELSIVFSLIPDAALCVFKTDQGNPAGSGNTWKSGTEHCTQTMVSAYGEGWRMPNLAEMYYKLHPSSSFAKTLNNNGRYLASTVKKGSTSSALQFLYTMETSSFIALQMLQGTTTVLAGNYRCVKTISD
jgi:hypothetical protein